MGEFHKSPSQIIRLVFDSIKNLINTSVDNLKFGDPRIPISLGLVPGVSLDNFLGINSDIDSGGLEDLISQGGTYEFLTVADFLEISSSNTNDTLLGTGARKILIQGCGENYVEQTETVEMNGTTVVTTVNKFIRVNNVYVVDSGTGNENAGDISIVDQATSATTVSFIGIGDNRALQFIYTVPAGKTAVIMQLTGSISRGSGSSSIKEASTRLQVRPFGFTNFIPLGQVSSRSDGSSVNGSDLSYPAAAAEKSDIRAIGDSLSNNTEVSLSASLIIVDNTTYGITLTGAL